jgi:hypothetical protein
VTNPVPSSKRVVFHEGDRFVINTPKVVVRVGYPLCIDDVKRELDNAPLDNRIKLFLSEFGLYSPMEDGADYRLLYGNTTEDTVVNEIKTALARRLLAMRGWGGNTRSIFEIEIPKLAGTEHYVYKKRVVRTGVRVGPSGSYEDYEPGYLSDMKTHILLQFHHMGFRNNTAEINQQYVSKI